MERNRSGQLNIARDLVTQIAKNILMGSPRIRNWRLKQPRTAIETPDIDKYLCDYAFQSLSFLLEYVGDLRGKSVCEIGPGDYLTSGISILAGGASNYGVIDRFPGNYYGATAKSWYRAIEENWSRFYPNLDWNPAISSEGFPENAKTLLELNGKPLESAETEKKFDIICSFQVGEHVSSVEAFAGLHNRILNDGGIGLHRVDFGPHDVWFSYRDPGTFLRFSDRTWHITGSNRGVPNRKRHHEFLAAFEGAGLDVEVLYRDYFDDKAMDLTRLNAKFREMPLDSVLTGTAIYRLTRK